uniref:Uncharacterized protein n=1 Tax=Chenopodium quinoa TaxID=63459 RepID=A0A803M5U1_CHEQI
MNLETQSSLLQLGSTSQPNRRKGPFRGPSRALKYKKLRSIQPGKLKEICPLDVLKWSDMPDGIVDQLYARIKELEAQACEHENEFTEINGSSSNVTTSSLANDDPMYLKLWEKSKRHKNGKFDNEAEEKFKELRELHEKEISEKRVDNLTLEEAYVKVLGHRPGYARGLGKGHLVSSKDRKIGRAELKQNVEKLQNENNIMRAELEASKKKQEDPEQKLRLIMEKIGLDA